MAQSPNLFRNPLFRWGLPTMSALVIVATAFFLVDDRMFQLMMFAFAAADLLVTPQILKRAARNA